MTCSYHARYPRAGTGHQACTCTAGPFDRPAWRVSAQDSARRDRRVQWAYVIRDPRGGVYVSAYRYRSQEGALAAGQADAEACAALEGELS